MPDSGDVPLSGPLEVEVEELHGDIDQPDDAKGSQPVELGDLEGLLTQELGETPKLGNLGDLPTIELGKLPPELGDFDGLLTGETENVVNEQEVKINPKWRVEKRNDRNPPGFAIYQRGKPVYIGYVGYNSKGKKPDGFPTYSQLAGNS